MNKKKFYSQKYFQERDILQGHIAFTLVSILKKEKVKKVLDVGCGTGKLVKYLNEKGFEAVGCDSSDEAVKLSGQIKAEATNLPFPNSHFDAVSAISLIEHLSKREADLFLKEVWRILKKDGVFFLVTPNLWSPMRFVKGKSWFGYSDPTHQTFYSPNKLRKILQDHRFKNIKLTFETRKETPFEWPISYVKLLPAPFQFLVNWFLISSPLALFRDSFWITAQKGKDENWNFG